MNSVTQIEKLDPHSRLAQSSVLLRLHIGIPELKRKDKKASAELADAKGAKRSRLRVHKSLIECATLDEMTRLRTTIRAFVDHHTVAWDDGVRWLSNENLIPVTNYVEEQFELLDTLRNDLLSQYPAEIAKAQLELADTFDESEYPSLQKYVSMFHWNLSIEPLPTGNDFRLQAEQHVIDDLCEKYNAALDSRIKAASQSLWERLLKPLTNMSERLADSDTGEHKRFHSTLVQNVLDIVDVMRSSNLTNDPEMDRVRKELKAVLTGVTADGLKSSDPLRRHTKQEIDKIIAGLPNFGL